MCLVEQLRIRAALTPDPRQGGQEEGRGWLTAGLPLWRVQIAEERYGNRTPQGNPQEATWEGED